MYRAFFESQLTFVTVLNGIMSFAICDRACENRAYLHNFEIPFFSLETIVILVRIYWLSFTFLHAIITVL